jgi:hypothetical protein
LFTTPLPPAVPTPGAPGISSTVPDGVTVILPAAPDGYDPTTMGFELHIYRTNDGADVASTGWLQNQTPPWGGTQVLTSLQPNKDYVVKARIYDKYGQQSEWSTQTPFTTPLPPAVPTPGAPGISSTVPDGVTVILPAAPDGYDPTTMGFELHIYRTNDGADVASTGWLQNQTPPWGGTQFLSGLQPGTSYVIRSRIYDKYGQEQFSDEVPV